MSKAKVGEDLWKNRVEKVVPTPFNYKLNGIGRMRNCLC